MAFPPLYKSHGNCIITINLAQCLPLPNNSTSYQIVTYFLQYDPGQAHITISVNFLLKYHVHFLKTPLKNISTKFIKNIFKFHTIIIISCVCVCVCMCYMYMYICMYMYTKIYLITFKYIYFSTYSLVICVILISIILLFYQNKKTL